MAGTMYKEEATDSSASYKGVGGTGAGILNYMSYGDSSWMIQASIRLKISYFPILGNCYELGRIWRLQVIGKG